jgi:quercetin dioxygenase-like cupin family protein
MKVIRIDELPAEKRSGGIFIGTVESVALVNESLGASDLKLDMIRFPRGVRNKLHSHTYDQVLYVTGGKGIVATEKEKKIVTPGFVAFIPRGELHWHGATEDSAFEHISILRPGETKY